MKVKPHIFERGDSIFMVGPVAPYTPADSDLEELAFYQDIRKVAPNEHILWMHGQYVEADRPNENGAMWSTDELATKKLTPIFMPVTVMHDPRTAVGLIADVVLRAKDETAGVPRTRIDSTLAMWKHRFPDVADEIASNYEAGTLMQSMECRPQFYDCGECGQRYPRLPGGAERANWCQHLTENAKAVRRLGNVTFTGVGLIFGNHGARGAFDGAHLEVLEDEVAEFHREAQAPGTTTPKPTRRRKGTMDIDEARHQELLRKEAELDQLKPRVGELEETAAKVPDLEKKVQDAEAEATREKQRAEDEEKKRKDLEENARVADLRTERLEGLGDGFKEKLGEFTKGKLEEQAGTMSEDEWNDRLTEIEETAGVKRDATKDGGENKDGGGQTFNDDEVARSGVTNGGGNGNGGGGDPAPAKTRSIVGGLVKAVSGTGQGK